MEGSLKSTEDEYNRVISQIAPVCLLPNEILAHIFEVGHASPSPILTAAFEILVSQVTQRWRNVAIHTPRIWSRIEISATTSGEFIAIYLQRSGVAALDLFIADRADRPYRRRVPGWQAVIPHFNRCRRIVASPDSIEDIMDEMLVAFRFIAVPLLERFQIIHNIPFESGIRVFDGGAPALRDVRLGGFDYCVPPLTNVTSLVLWNHYTAVSWSSFRDMVGGLLSLTHLVIGFPFADAILPDGFESTISLPSLYLLRIHVDFSTPYPEQILLGISAPSLGSLVLDGIVSEDLTDFCEDGAKIGELDKFPCLQSFTFLHSDLNGVSQETWSSFCDIFPHITHLAFNFGHNQQLMPLEPFIEAMVFNTTNPDTTKPPILPELHTLSFSKMNQPSVKLLSDLVSMRDALRRPLTLMHVPKTLLGHEQFSDSLQKLQEYVELKEYQPRDWNVHTMAFE
jgi:hypothetical protein